MLELFKERAGFKQCREEDLGLKSQKEKMTYFLPLKLLFVRYFPFLIKLIFTISVSTRNNIPLTSERDTPEKFLILNSQMLHYHKNFPMK